jgi:hypothetical protein
VARENAKAVVLDLVKQQAAGIADGDMPESLFHRGKMVVASTFWRYKDRRMSDQCPLYPRKQTSAERVGMSAKCQKQTLALLTHGPG